LSGLPFKLGLGVASRDAAWRFVAERDPPETGIVKGAFKAGVKKNSAKPKNTALDVMNFLKNIFT
jgi:hypothetical protein